MQVYQKVREGRLGHLWKKLQLSLWPYQAHVLSYPKSGRTWVRLLVGEALCHQFNLPYSLVLRTQVLTPRAGLLKTVFGHDGTALSSHNRAADYRSSKEKYANARVILLTRDVRDLVVSAFYQARYREKIYTGTLSEFIRDDRYGVEKILAFYRDWDRHKQVPRDFMTISYEEFHRNTHSSLKRVLGFIGLSDPDEKSITYAVEKCDFTEMRRKEESDYFEHNTLRPGEFGRNESYKTRKGEVGGYRDDLSEEDVAYIDGEVAKYGISFISD